MKTRNYLTGLAYFADLDTSSLGRFLDFFDSDLQNIKPNHKEVIDFLKKKIIELRMNNGPMNQSFALKELLARDLEALLESAKKEKDKMTDPEMGIEEANSFFVDELKKLGLETVPYKLEVVDQFPSIWAKYEDKYGAVGLGPGYQKFYDIEPGIYIHRKNLTPVFTKGMLLPHEIMHHVINKYSDTEFGRGLEEGLCDLMGHAYLGSKMVGHEVVKKRFIYSFYRDDIRDSTKEYYYFSRQAGCLYLNYGLDGVIALIKGGRKKIREVEQHLSAGEFKKIDLPKGGWQQDFTNLVNYITLTYIPHLVVSPLARYVAEHIDAGDDLEPLREKLKIKKADFNKAIDELDSAVDLIQCYKGNVNYSVLPYALGAKSLRYKVQG